MNKNRLCINKINDHIELKKYVGRYNRIVIGIR